MLHLTPEQGRVVRELHYRLRYILVRKTSVRTAQTGIFKKT